MKPLPSFRRPPVNEVAIAVQFDDVPGLTGPTIGILWQRFREEFPRLDLQQPRAPSFERFELPDEPAGGVSVDVGIPVPRVWFVSADDSELIQVQQNRFVFNWRARGGQYPRYESVRQSFSGHLAEFRAFLADEGLEDIRLNQWELSYVNHIRAEGEPTAHGGLTTILPSWEHRPSDDFLPVPENVGMQIRYQINDSGAPVGRLHIVVDPRFTLPEKEPIWLIRMTARGEPRGVEDPVDVFRYLDIGHDWIVRGFTSITSPNMHQVWERER